MNNKMFCFQCEQTANGTGCLGEMGVCGKKAETAKLQDELTEKLITLAITLSHDNSKITETTKSLIIEGLFTTVTNVSFENKRIRKLIEEVHKEIKRCLIELFGTAAEEIPVLYGGSVNMENAEELISRPSIDGLFVGRAAWQADKFNDLIRLVRSNRK